MVQTQVTKGMPAKAILAAVGEEAPKIEFMFNPTELTFDGVVETADNPGVHSQRSGKPKVSFSNIQAYRITISNILFDTYETGENVVSKYIDKFKKSVQFVEGKERPPIYTFSWGSQIYMKYCFVEKLAYKLTMFLADGTPVRAAISSLTLKETDVEDAQLPAAQPDRRDNRASRTSRTN